MPSAGHRIDVLVQSFYRLKKKMVVMVMIIEEGEKMDESLLET